MIIRPDARRFTVLDILIEFKFVTLKEAGLFGEQAQTLDMGELQELPLMGQAMAEAQEQVRRNMGP